MTKEAIIKFAEGLHDSVATEVLRTNFDTIKNHPDVSMEGIQSVFTEKKVKIQDILRGKTEHEHRIAVACMIDEVMENLNAIGENEVAQGLQRVYEDLFTALISQRMWEIARESANTTIVS